MNDDETFIRNATCYPYFYEPQYVVQRNPALRYTHTVLFVLCTFYIIMTTAKYFYHRKIYVRLQKRPVSATLATSLGTTILLIGNLLQPLLDLPSVYLLFVRIFVVPLLGFSVVVRLADYYNRYILAQTLLTLAQRGSENDVNTGSQEREAVEEGASTRSQALLAVWTYLKDGKIDNKVVPPRRLNNGQEDRDEYGSKANGSETGQMNQINDDERKRNMITKRAIKLLKFLSSNTFYFLCFMVLSLPFIINFIVVMTSVPCYNLKYLCYSCPRPNFALAAVICTFIIIFGLLFAYLVRRFPDPFGIVKEFKIIVIFAATPALIAFILNARFDDGFSKHFSFGWVLSLFMVSYQFISVDLQIYNAKHDKTEKVNRPPSNHVDQRQVTSRGESHLHPTSVEDANGMSAVDGLEVVLSDPQEIRLFEKHLVSEFAVETITMYQDCAKFVRQFYDMNENTRRARARRIIQQHVDDDALMQVNLPYQIKIDLIDKINDPAPITIALFNDAQREVFGMLLGSYLRYTKTDLYKEEHPNAATATLSL